MKIHQIHAVIPVAFLLVGCATNSSVGEKFNQIKPGMTYAQAEVIMGPPLDTILLTIPKTGSVGPSSMPDPYTLYCYGQLYPHRAEWWNIPARYVLEYTADGKLFAKFIIPSREDFAKTKLGMTKLEVDTLMGSPNEGPVFPDQLGRVKYKYGQVVFRPVDSFASHNRFNFEFDASGHLIGKEDTFKPLPIGTTPEGFIYLDPP